MPKQPDNLESAMMRLWLRRGAAACALWPLSLLFRATVALRRKLYALGWLGSTRLPVPVIIVGNIFIGGTGKTPFVIWLVEALRSAGFTPGVISRGHGTKNDQPQAVLPTSLPDKVGDEPLLIARRTNCPLMVGRNRAAAGQVLLAAHPEIDVLISDDGLQHYALQRDIEIALFDDRGIGNGWLLPAGPLREPPTRGRDFTVVNTPRLIDSHDMHGAYAMRLSGGVAEPLADRSRPVPLGQFGEWLASKLQRPAKIAAVAGIGNPSRFFSMLRNSGLHFTEHPLPDHFDYKTSPFDKIDADFILVTEKDAVKCSLFESPENIGRLWVVPVSAQIEAALAERIVERLRGCRTA